MSFTLHSIVGPAGNDWPGEDSRLADRVRPFRFFSRVFAPQKRAAAPFLEQISQSHRNWPQHFVCPELERNEFHSTTTVRSHTTLFSPHHLDTNLLVLCELQFHLASF